MRLINVGLVVALALASVQPAHAADRTFASGSLIIPMDLPYQGTGMLQAYGLLYQLLKGNVRVYWVIDPNKTYCDDSMMPCAWDCAIEGSGVKCPYPSASPDFLASTKVVWSDVGTPVDTAITHRYRGGPFVIDSADALTAMTIINAWNQGTIVRVNPEVVTVHEATAAFTGNVAKEMVAAPTIAVFADGKEDIATGYLRKAGIPQSNGMQFPSSTCNGACGPGTANPDMLIEEAVMGPLGTCSAPNRDHKNGALWRSDGLPAYCQIMSMHWAVTERERVTCSPNCGTTCTGQAYTFHGHEVIAEVRAFLGYPVHFFAECQAVNAYENTVPNPAYPYLDDDGRDGHFLTTTGTPPPCPCATGFTCNTATNTCEPTNDIEKGAGFLVEAKPTAAEIQVLRPDVPYNQFDGAFTPEMGSEESYNLSTYLMTKYKNDRQVTLLTGADGPGDQDVWMSGYLDGSCDIILGPPGGHTKAGSCHSGKVSYLGGHDYNGNIPVTSGGASQGTRLFLNALFEADCVTAEGQPSLSVSLTPTVAVGPAYPIEQDFVVGYSNATAGFSYDGKLDAVVGDAPDTISADQSGTITATGPEWQVGSIGGLPGLVGDPAASGTRTMRLSFPAGGDYPITVGLDYRVGTSTLNVQQTFMVHVGIDSDGDGSPDDQDEYPEDPTKCGDSNGDGCDDCATGTLDLTAACDPGTDGGASPGGCCDTGGTPVGPSLLGFVVVVLLARRRRMR